MQCTAQKCHEVYGNSVVALRTMGAVSNGQNHGRDDVGGAMRRVRLSGASEQSPLRDCHSRTGSPKSLVLTSALNGTAAFRAGCSCRPHKSGPGNWLLLSSSSTLDMVVVHVLVIAIKINCPHWPPKSASTCCPLSFLFKCLFGHHGARHCRRQPLGAPYQRAVVFTQISPTKSDLKSASGKRILASLLLLRAASFGSVFSLVKSISVDSFTLCGEHAEYNTTRKSSGAIVITSNIMIKQLHGAKKHDKESDSSDHNDSKRTG